MKTLLIILGLALASVGFSETTNDYPKAALKLAGYARSVVPVFVKLKDRGKLDGLKETDQISDFSVYQLNERLRSLKAFKEVVKAGRNATNLTLVDVQNKTNRFAYLFRCDKAPPELVGAFRMDRNKWVSIKHKSRSK